MDPYSNLIMAPKTFVLKVAVQVKVTESPTVPVGVAEERDTDVIKLLGTEKNKHRNFYTLTSAVEPVYVWQPPFGQGHAAVYRKVAFLQKFI